MAAIEALCSSAEPVAQPSLSMMTLKFLVNADLHSDQRSVSYMAP